MLKTRNSKRAKVLIPLLAGFLLIGSVGIASQSSANIKPGSADNDNCVCSVEPQNYSTILDQQTCEPHNYKKVNDHSPTYKERIEKLRRELLGTTSAT
jgi:hypothetical protein